MKRLLTLALACFMIVSLALVASADVGDNAFEEVWVTAEQEFYDDPETLWEGGSGQPIQYVNGYGVGYSSLNDQVIFRSIDFGSTGAEKMLINFSNGGADNTTLAIYIDEKNGDPAATFSIPNTGGWEATFAEDFETPIDVQPGVHDVIIEFTNSNSGSFYYIQFFEKGAGGTSAAASSDFQGTVAHWRFQNDPAYVTGSVDDDNITVLDLTGNGNDLVVATVGNGDQLDIFTWDDGCDIPTAKGNTALKFDNTKKQAATVDPYTEAETSYTGGYTSGKYLETVENAPMNSMTFEEGFSFEIVYKLSSELDNNYNRYTGLFSRQGVVDTANEPPFSIALTEWSNDANGTLGVNGTGMQYVHVDPDGMKTNQEYNDGAGTMYGGEWHHILVTCEDDMTEIYIDGNDVALIGESTAIAVTDPTYSWEVGVGRKLGEGHEGDSKNVNSPEGMIRRLFAGDISEIRVTNHYMENEESLFFKSADINYSAAGGASAGTAEAEEAPAAATGAELLNKSWDTIFVDYEMMVDGSANVWLADNPVAGPIDQVEVRGWAHLSTPITAFAYAIDGGDPVKSEDFIQDRPDVKAAIHEDAEGFDISIELEGLAVGDHLIKVYAVDADGNLVDTTFDFPITIEAKPSKGLATVEDAAKGKNIITNYEFVSGSNGFGGEGPENLFDGDTATKFCTNEFPAEAIAKLDGVYKITGFTMATANDNADYNGRSPNAWTISVSPDGENWTDLKKGDDSFFEELNFTYFAGEGKAENVGYVKFTADGTASGTFQVSELTLFGDKTGDAPAAEEAPAEEETPAPAEEETPAETPTTTEPTTPAADTKPAETETAKSGCGSMIGGGLIVLVTVLGSAWIAKRR